MQFRVNCMRIGTRGIGMKFYLCSYSSMMIRPDDDELASAIQIALLTAKTYALRDVFSSTRAFNRRVAVDTLTARIVAALRPYEITRQAKDSELDDRTMPLFLELEREQRSDELIRVLSDDVTDSPL